NTNAVIHRRRNADPRELPRPITLSTATYRIDIATSVTTSGANHDRLGAMPNADAMKVIDSAATNDPTIATTSRGLRNGTTRQSRNSTSSTPLSRYVNPIEANAPAVWYHLGSSRMRPGSPPSYSNVRIRPSGARNRRMVRTRRPNRSKRGWIEKRDWSDRIV